MKIQTKIKQFFTVLLTMAVIITTMPLNAVTAEVGIL